MSYIGNTPSGVDLNNSYIGNSPFTTSHVDNFNGDGSTTAFTLTKTPASTADDFFLVFVDNVYQREGSSYAFTVSGSTITFTSAPASGTNNIQVYQLGSEGIISTISDGAVTADKLGTSAVETAKINDDAVTSAKIADDAVTISQVDSSSVTLGFRNRIIGGNFSTNPWQRGTSFTGPTSAYTADRFRPAMSTTGVIDIDKTADAPTVSEAGVFTQHCLDVDVTTADTSIAAGDYALLYQPIEGYNSLDLGFGQSGTRYLTLSFWHKHTKTGTQSVAITNSDNSRSYVAEYTQSTSNTWEKAEITIPVDTSGTWIYDNGIGIKVWFCMMIGSTYSGSAGSWSGSALFGSSNQVNNLDSTSNNFKIALVQLEAGQTGTAFENRSVGQELELCQRYFQVGEFLQYAASSSYTHWYYSQIDFITQMRANPTMTNTSGGSPYQTASGNSGVNFTSQSPRRTVTYPSNSAGWHAVSFNYSADAEL